MAECRFHGECRLAGGLSPRMCDGKGMITTLSAVGYVYNKCGRFSPMPDKDALLALADEMDESGRHYGEQIENFVTSDIIDDAPGEFRDYARRIREACGEAKA